MRGVAEGVAVFLRVILFLGPRQVGKDTAKAGEWGPLTDRRAN